MKPNWLLSSLLSAAILLCVASCGGGGGDNDSSASGQGTSNPSQQGDPSQTVQSAEVSYINDASNPLIAQIRPEGGEAVTFYGRRDSDGNVVVVNGLFTGAIENDTPTMRLDFDVQGRFKFARFDDGSTMDFVWETNNRAIATWTSADGLTSEFQTLDFPTSEATVAAVAHAASASRPQSALVVTVTADNDIPQTNADVWATATAKNPVAANTRYPVPMEEIGNGRYLGGFTNRATPLPAPLINEKCKVGVQFVSALCEEIKGMGSYMALSGCLSYKGLWKKSACVALYGAIRATCPFAKPQRCDNLTTIIEFVAPDGVDIIAGAKKWGREGAAPPLHVKGDATNVEVAVKLRPRKFEVNTVDTGTCRDSGGSATYSGDLISTSDNNKFIISIAGRPFAVNAPGTTDYSTTYPEAGGTTNETVQLHIGDSGDINGAGKYSGTYPNESTGELFSCGGGYSISGRTSRFK